MLVDFLSDCAMPHVTTREVVEAVRSRVGRWGRIGGPVRATALYIKLSHSPEMLLCKPCPQMSDEAFRVLCRWFTAVVASFYMILKDGRKKESLHRREISNYKIKQLPVKECEMSPRSYFSGISRN